MTELSEYGFNENPFSLLPGTNVTNWAGRDEIRRRLVDIVESPRTADTGLSEFVILLGTFGAGKSHALRYLATTINETEADHYGSHAIYIPKVKLSANISFQTLYFEIVQELGAEFLKDLAGAVRGRIKIAADQLGEECEREEERRLREEDSKHFEKKVIASMLADDQPVIRLLMQLAEGEQKVVTYLLEGKPPVPNSDFSQKIDTDFMATKVLSGLFRAMSIEIAGQDPVFSCVHLFLDEVEDLMEAKAPDQAAFWQAIRELVNRLPNNFALILAFSADTALLEAIMPLALAERTTRQNVELPALEIDEAKEFLQSHFLSFRPDDFNAPHPYWPFSEDAIDRVLEQIVVLVPRKIFRALRAVLERSIKREGLNPGDEITPESAEEILISMGM